ncbi:IclR family transcriptional regulator [Sphingomonas bisphenolicum]|nr:IclR family transcriptional regulator [Sphingomonas bisphenolicum]
MEVLEMRSEGTGTIIRVVRLMRCLAEAQGDISITDISRQLNLAPSTVHRLLQLLLTEDIVAKSSTRSLYGPGMELLRIAALLASKIQIGDVARNVMQGVSEQAQEAVLLTQLLPHELKVMVTASVASPHPLRYDIDMFQRGSLLRGATGRAILAFLDGTFIAEIFDRLLQDDSDSTFANREDQLADLAAIRARGYVITHGQKVPGAVGIGAPVFDGHNKVVAALSITMPEQRFAAARAEELAKIVVDGAAAISKLLGRR